MKLVSSLSKHLARRQMAKRFNACIDLHHAALFKHALWLVGNRQDAEDMVQETYYQAWRSFPTLKEEGSMLAWLLTILRRSAAREYRGRARNKDLRAALTAGLDERASGIAPQDMLDVFHALDSLNPALRDTLLLFALHGFSYLEISAQLEVPVGTVMSRIARARTALRKQLSVDDGNVIPFER
ncbi:MAG TPA: sigma-70 family RNA polymerase sigma factor [Chromatiaceae bacterium]|nr:sigma-70 family RNA polymerase sigma factor [Chromatiaceae bacterium]